MIWGYVIGYSSMIIIIGDEQQYGLLACGSVQKQWDRSIKMFYQRNCNISEQKVDLSATAF